MSAIILKINILFIIIGYICCLQLTIEKWMITYVNEKYLGYATLDIQRNGKKGEYTVDIDGSIKSTWSNNVTLHMLFNEYQNGEYRPTSIDLKFKLCDFLNKNDQIKQLAVAAGIKCPVLPNEYHFKNVPIPLDSIPVMLPFEKTRLDIELMTTKTKEALIKVNIFAVLGNKKEHKKKE